MLPNVRYSFADSLRIVGHGYSVFLLNIILVWTVRLVQVRAVLLILPIWVIPSSHFPRGDKMVRVRSLRIDELGRNVDREFPNGYPSRYNLAISGHRRSSPFEHRPSPVPINITPKSNLPSPIESKRNFLSFRRHIQYSLLSADEWRPTQRLLSYPTPVFLCLIPCLILLFKLLLHARWPGYSRFGQLATLHSRPRRNVLIILIAMTAAKQAGNELHLV